jgi:hypothetical protein
MSRIRLEIEESFDFRILGISCHEKDYRLVWALNQHAGFRLERRDDLKLEAARGKPLLFPFFEHVDEEQFKTYQLLANRFGNHTFLPELPNIDFLFFIRGDADDTEVESILERIHRVEFVVLASELDISKIRQKENLLFF